MVREVLVCTEYWRAKVGFAQDAGQVAQNCTWIWESSSPVQSRPTSLQVPLPVQHPNVNALPTTTSLTAQRINPITVLDKNESSAIERKKTLRSFKEKKNPQPKEEVKTHYDKIKCHYCRNNDTSRGYTVCSNYPNCRRAFCDDCLRSYFKQDARFLNLNWECVACEDICNCCKCEERRHLRLQLNDDERITYKTRFKRQYNGVRRPKKKSKGVSGVDSEENRQHPALRKKRKKTKQKSIIRKWPKVNLSEVPKEESDPQNNQRGNPDSEAQGLTPSIAPAICAPYGSLPVGGLPYQGYPMPAQNIPYQLVFPGIYQPRPLLFVNAAKPSPSPSPLSSSLPNIKEEGEEEEVERRRRKKKICLLYTSDAADE
eukprot:TRINITY_DN3040_c0_g3_i1.p1 TRINITY_DN3040_c0_g3~~TRINITY_DN3040_c0_g3_i1.p1  ORF type:complete len:372 (-),score=32.15 TRINITY_DN3040_c0_g3_i1:10-1125(-)